MKDNKAIQELEFNMDNLELLKAIKYLTNCVINDILLMNEEYLYGEKEFLGTAYNLGNGNCIRIEDYESLVSIIDTINDIQEYNEED